MAINAYVRIFDYFYRLLHSGSLNCYFENELICDCPGGCCGNIACLLPYKVRQLPVFRSLLSFATEITHDARPTIIVAQLMVIVKMGLGACSFFFGLERQPIQWLYITTTNSQCNYLAYRTKNLWNSIDSHFQDQASNVSLSRWLIMASCTVHMCNNHQVTLSSLDLDHQKSLTLCWCLFEVIVAISYLAVLPINTANTCSWYYNDQVTDEYPDLQNQK